MAKDLVASLKIENENAKQKITELKAKVKELDSQCKILGKNAQASAKSSGDAFKMWGNSLKDANTFAGKLQRGISSVAGGPMNDLASSMGMNVAGLAKFGTGVGVAVAAGAALIDVTKQAVVASAEFGKSMTQLSAITGVSGKDLDSMRGMIQRLAVDTNTSSNAVSQNFAQIGSALPQLLKDADGLKSVSASAISLSKAGVMPLADATDSLTATMAQFNISADDASSVTDILANSAQLGAAGIKEVADTLQRCGTAANMAGVGLKDTAAMAEVLASKGIKGAEAGTALRNVFTKMSTSGIDEMNPKVVGLTNALEYLKGKANDAQFMVKTFGAENMTAASILANNIPMFDQLSEGLGKVGTASDMASQNTNNLASDWEAMGTQWENFLSSFNVDGENNPLRVVVQEITNIIKAINDFFQTVNTPDSMGFLDEIDINPLRDLLGIITDLIQYFGALNKTTDGVSKSMKPLELVWTNLGIAIKAVREILWWCETAILAVAKAWEDFKTSVKNNIKMPEWMGKLKEWADSLWKAIKKLIDIYRELKGAAADAVRNGDVDGTTGAAKKAPKAQETTPDPTPDPSPTTSTTTKTGKGAKSETPLEKYNREIAASAAAYKNGLIKESDYIQKQISATQSYIDSLSKDEKSIRANVDKIKKLNNQVDNFKSQLAIIKIRESVADDMEDAMDKLKDGMITTDEYNTKYRDGLKRIIDEYYKLENVTEEQREEQKKYIKKLKEFDSMKELYEQAKKDIENDKTREVSSYDVTDAIAGRKPNDIYKSQRAKEVDGKNFYREYQVDKKSGMSEGDLLKKWNQKYADFIGGKAKASDYDGISLKQMEVFYKGVENLSKTLANADSYFIERQKSGTPGDETNYGLKASSNKKLTDDNTFMLEPKGLDKVEMQMDMLLQRHKEIEDAALSYQKTLLDSGKTIEETWDDEYIKNATSALEDLEVQIGKVGDTMQSKLNTRNLVSGISELANGLYSIGSNIQMWSNLGESIDNAKNDFDAFMIIFSAGIQTFELITGLIEGFNTVMSLFSGVQSASAVATDLAAASEGAKAGVDTAAIAPAVAATAANKVLEASYLDLAAASIFAAHAAIPFVGPSIAAGLVGEMMAAMAIQAAASQALVAFANGGVVPGASFSGDKVVARLNSGEMVLNTGQQKNLFDALDNGFALGGGGDVNFVLRGSDLYGSLRNYGKVKAKSGKSLF